MKNIIINGIKNKTKKLFFFIFISFCITSFSNVYAYEYDDENCITDIREATLTGKPCKSLDLGVLKHKSNYTKAVYEPFYSSNEFLDDEKMNTYNNLDYSKNQLGISQAAQKKSFADITFKPYLFVFCILFFIFRKMISKEDFNDFLSFVVMCSMVIFILDTTVKTEETTVPVVRATIEANNYLNRMNQINVTSEDRMINNIVTNFSKNEALIDASDLIKLNVCLSNSQKYNIENRDYSFNYFYSKKEIADFYRLKNEPYIVGNQERGDRKIGITLGDGGFPKSINFANCGQVYFSSRKIDQDTIDIMQNIGFKQRLHKAIKDKEFELQLTEMKNSYIQLVGNEAEKSDKFIGDSNKEQFIKLLVIFATEYKKGMMWGSIYTNYELENPTVINTDFSNFTNRQELADGIYNNIVSAQCIKNGDFVNDTVKAVSNFPSNSNSIGQYDCVNIVGDDVITATIPYIYKENKLLIDDKRIGYRDNSLPLAEAAAADLITQYEIVSNVFDRELNSVSNYYTDLAYIYNKGGYAASEFFTYMHNNSNKHSSVYAQLIDVNRIDLSQSLPDFNFDKTPNIKTDVFIVNTFMKTTLDKIDLERGQISTNVANSLIEYSTDNTGDNASDALITTNSTSTDTFTSFLENNSEIFSSVNKMVCSGDKEKCMEQYKNFDGSAEWNTLSHAITKTGSEAMIYSTGAYLALASAKGVVNWQKRDGDTKQALFGNNSKAGKAIALLDTVKTAAGSIAALSVFSVILGNLMISLFSFQGFVLGWFEQAQIIYLSIIPNLIIMVCVIGLMTNYTVKSYTKTLSLIMNLILYPLIITLSVSIISYFSNYMLISMLDSIPNIGQLILSDEKGSALDMIISSIRTIAFLIIIMIVGNVLILKLLIDALSKLSTNSFDGAFETAETVINRSQMVIMGSAVGVAMNNTSRMIKKGIKKQIIKPKD